MTDLRRTGLYDLHVELGAKMVPFAGWSMPVQYPMGVMNEHLHTRAHAGLFDVSHMGQVILRGDVAETARVLERLMPANIQGIAPGRQRYALLTNDQGGILDDLMVANRGDHIFLVVNAGCAEQDIAHLQAQPDLDVQVITDRGLLALQGPEAEDVLAALIPAARDLKFMDVAILDWNGVEVWVTRGGYTGEDGFEISVPNTHLDPFARALLADERVAPIGLGARDSLRLEAGMPLYGNDMDATVLPGQAGLGFSIPKLRREGDRAGGFPGADAILADLANPTVTRRGLRPEGRAPIREGVNIFDAETGGSAIGTVSSGGFGPSAGGPVAMARLPVGVKDGDIVWAELRGRRIPVTVVALPFVTPSYKR